VTDKPEGVGAGGPRSDGGVVIRGGASPLASMNGERRDRPGVQRSDLGLFSSLVDAGGRGGPRVSEKQEKARAGN